MILITNIEWQEVPGNHDDLYTIIGDMEPQYRLDEMMPHDAPLSINAHVVTEAIRGHRFTKHFEVVGGTVQNPWEREIRTEEICIGTKKEYQDLLGMPLESMESLHRDMRSYQCKMDIQGAELRLLELAHKELTGMNFWQRLKWAFTGGGKG